MKELLSYLWTNHPRVFVAFIAFEFSILIILVLFIVAMLKIAGKI